MSFNKIIHYVKNEEYKQTLICSLVLGCKGPGSGGLRCNSELSGVIQGDPVGL